MNSFRFSDGNENLLGRLIYSRAFGELDVCLQYRDDEDNYQWVPYSLVSVKFPEDGTTFKENETRVSPWARTILDRSGVARFKKMLGEFPVYEFDLENIPCLSR